MAVDPDRCYVIDTCAIMDLTGDNPRTSYTNDETERERIFVGLERLIEEGRLWAVYAQKDEFERRCSAHKRLGKLGDKFYQSDSAGSLVAVMGVLEHTDERTRRRAATRKHIREPADPYIAALAKERGCWVVTNEKHRSERAKSKGEQRLPDLCDDVGVGWMHLDAFIVREGLGP